MCGWTHFVHLGGEEGVDISVSPIIDQFFTVEDERKVSSSGSVCDYRSSTAATG